MKQYFNRYDREQHVLMMVFNFITLEWLERCKSITKEERKYFKIGLTWLKKGYDSMIVRSSDEYVTSLKNTAKHSDLFLEDTTAKCISKEIPTKTIRREDYFDLAHYALYACVGCQKKDFNECERYKLFMRLETPPFNEETAECPYAQPVFETVDKTEKTL